MGYPEDVQCPDWCVGGTARAEERAGGHFTDFIEVTGLDDGQEIFVRGIGGWYEDDSDYVEIHVTDSDGTTAVLKLDADEWDVTSGAIDQLINLVT